MYLSSASDCQACARVDMRVLRNFLLYFNLDWEYSHPLACDFDIGMLESERRSSFWHDYRARRPSPSASSTLSSTFSDVDVMSTVSTEDSNESSFNESFSKRFPAIIQRWRNSSLVKDDYEYLHSLQFSEAEFVTITETYGLRHGIELYDHRIVLTEYPTSTHEAIIRRLEKLIDRTYQDDLGSLGSSSKISGLDRSDFQHLFMPTDEGRIQIVLSSL